MSVQTCAAVRPNMSLALRARNIRRKALLMGEVQGQGYIGQALGVADLLVTSYFHALDFRPEDPEWEGRDRSAKLAMRGPSQRTPKLGLTPKVRARASRWRAMELRAWNSPVMNSHDSMDAVPVWRNSLPPGHNARVEHDDAPVHSCAGIYW